MSTYRLAIILLLGSSCSEGLPNKERNDIAEGMVDNVQIVSDSTGQQRYTDPNDTIFLHRKVTDYFYHAIYIEKDRTGRFYERLTSFEFNERNEQGYLEMLNMMADVPRVSTRPSTLGLPKNWLPLYKYKNGYYLYTPSDWGNAGRRILNDSVFVYWYMDGPDPRPLLDVKRLSDHRYSVRFIDPYDRTEPTELTIHFVDPKTKMAVFEFSHESDQYRYQLFVPADSAHHFDMIVNYCEDQKQLEFKFDQIDYESLLTNR